jgi:hypothetical protein
MVASDAPTTAWESSTQEIFELKDVLMEDLGMLGEHALELRQCKKYGDDHGGLFYTAERNLDPNTFIRFYVGLIVEEGGKSDFALTLFTGKKHTWLIDGAEVGNEVRYINHSHSPNVEYRVGYMVDVLGSFPCVVSLKTIRHGDELLADYEIIYNALVEKNTDPLDACVCEAAHCCKVIGNRSQTEGSEYEVFIRKTSINPRVSSYIERKSLSKTYTKLKVFYFFLISYFQFSLLTILSHRHRS